MQKKKPTERDRHSPARKRLERFARQDVTSLYTLFFRSLGDSERARDLVQDTLMDAWKNLTHYDTSRPIRNWVFRIAQNRLRNHLRRRRLERQWIEPLGEEGEGKAASPLDSLVAKETEGLVEQALLRLPYRQRMAVLLRYQEEFSCAEIGEVLGISANAVSIQLHRARQSMKQLLGEKLVGGGR